MTLYQFNQLDEMERAEDLWEAVHLMDRVDGPYRYELFQLDGFYIEQKRHIEYNVLHGLLAFKSTELLDAYYEGRGYGSDQM
jgi:hypothetical protein